MGSNTTRAGLPYPVGTDRVMDGDNAMAALAKRLDGSDAAGPQSVPFSIAANLAAVPFAAVAQAQVAVTFPAGRFTQPPMVAGLLLAAPGGTNATWVRTTGSVTATSVTFVVNSVAAHSTTCQIMWIAVQMTSTSGGG